MSTKLTLGAKRRVYELMRAMLGNVSWNFRAVWLLDASRENVSLRFLLEVEDQEDREAIQDIASEFEAQQDRRIDLSVRVQISAEALVEPEDASELVYARREMNDKTGHDPNGPRSVNKG